MTARPRFLVYLRTHRGDPGPEGIFGIHDCMKSVREKDFDAVIGVGGKRPWKGDEGIARRVTWVGHGPTRARMEDKEHAVVSFDEFFLYDERGPLLEEVAPALAARMFGQGGKRHARVLLNLRPTEYAEAMEILSLARGAWRTQYSSAPELISETRTNASRKSSRCGEVNAQADSPLTAETLRRGCR